MENTDIFWVLEPSILYKGNNFFKIIPKSNMTLNEKLNAITRLCIIGLIIGLFFHIHTLLCSMIIIIILIVIFGIWNIIQESRGSDDIENIMKNDKNIDHMTDIDIINVIETDKKNIIDDTVSIKFLEDKLYELSNKDPVPENADDELIPKNNDFSKFYTDMFKRPEELYQEREFQHYDIAFRDYFPDQSKFEELLYDPNICKADQKYCQPPIYK